MEMRFIKPAIQVNDNPFWKQITEAIKVQRNGKSLPVSPEDISLLLDMIRSYKHDYDHEPDTLNRLDQIKRTLEHIDGTEIF